VSDPPGGPATGNKNALASAPPGQEAFSLVWQVVDSNQRRRSHGFTDHDLCNYLRAFDLGRRDGRDLACRNSSCVYPCRAVWALARVSYAATLDGPKEVPRASDSLEERQAFHSECCLRDIHPEGRQRSLLRSAVAGSDLDVGRWRRSNDLAQADVLDDMQRASRSTHRAMA
jgi:hypothetical protein